MKSVRQMGVSGMTAKRPDAEALIRESSALRTVQAANASARATPPRSEARMSAELDLRHAVDAARDLGLEWGKIAGALGVARGNAYQKYRRPSTLPRMDAPAL
jgi:hypothetical protein